MERRKAALTTVAKVGRDRDFRYAAIEGVVDQTSEALPLGSGSSAMGPPSAGKNR